MGIYYILIIAIVGCGYYLCDKKNYKYSKLIFILSSGVAFTLMSTLRYSIGFDYFSYQDIFETIKNANFEGINQAYSSYLGYAYINKIIAMLGGNYFTVLLFFNIVMNGIVFYTIYKHSKMPWLSVLSYLCLQIFPHSMNLFRQSIAVAIIFAGVNFMFIKCNTKLEVLWKQFLPYAVLVLIATSIHITSIVMLPMFFMFKIKFTWKSGAVIAGISLIIYLFSVQIFDLFTQVILPLFSQGLADYFLAYKNTVYFQGNSFIYSVFPLIFFIGTIPFSYLLVKKDARNSVIINGSFYFALISLFMTKHFIFERFSIFFCIFCILLLPEIACLFGSTKDDKKIADTKVDYKKAKLSKSEIEKIKSIKRKTDEQDFYHSWVVWFSVAFCVIFLSFSAIRGYHKVYPYTSVFDQHQAVDNNEFLQQIQTAQHWRWF